MTGMKYANEGQNSRGDQISFFTTLLSMDLIIFSNYLSLMNNKHDGKKIKNHFSPNKIVGRAF